MLAALDHNKNCGRAQATIKTGERKGMPRFNVVCPKGRKGWVAKKVFAEKSFQHVDNMVISVIDLCKKAGEGAQLIPRRELPKNIAPMEKPAKEQVVEEHRSRFPERN